MLAELKQELCEGFLSSWEPPYTGSIATWAADNLWIDGKRFNPSASPWFNEIYDAVLDPSIKIVIVQGATGLYKTGFQNSVSAYWIANDAGNIIQIYPTDDIGKDFIKTRLAPMLQDCEPIKAITGGKEIKCSPSGLITLPHMSIKVSGPTGKIQHGYSAKFLQMDDAQQIKELYAKIFKRVRNNYKGTKIVITATAGEQVFSNKEMVGDELSVLVNSGRIKRRSWQCPKCGEYQIHKFALKRPDGKGYSGINWTEVKTADGSTNIEETAKTARLECFFCHHQVPDDPQVRRKLEETARYSLIKKEGASEIITFQIPAWVAPFNTYKDACAKYLTAKKYTKARIFDYLKEFYTQVAAEEWNNKNESVDVKLWFQKFDPQQSWPDERYRFMSVDVQQDGFYYMIIAFDALGNGRLINYGFVRSWFEVKEAAIRNKVMTETGGHAHCIGVDCGYDTKTVAAKCIELGKPSEPKEGEDYGWLMLRGENKESFKHRDGETPVHRLISEGEYFETGPDTPPARRFFWSNYAVKNLVAAIRDGHHPLKFALNSQDETLNRQLQSEYPDAEGNWQEKSKDNHYWDCLCMCYALGELAGISFFK